MTGEELAAWWRSFCEKECRGYSSLYERICTSVATSEAVLDRLLSLPGHAQQPNMLLAAVHDLVLLGGAPVLADEDQGTASVHVGDDFVDAVLESWGSLLPVLADRRTQTNEIGRTAVLAPALAAMDRGEPPTVVDVWWYDRSPSR